MGVWEQPFQEEVVLQAFGDHVGLAHFAVALDTRYLMTMEEARGEAALDTDHMGTHPSFIDSALHSRGFVVFIYNLFMRMWRIFYCKRSWAVQSEVVVVMTCKSGVHRAVAGAYLAALALEAYPAEFQVMEEIGGLNSPQAGIRCWAGDRVSQPCEQCRSFYWRQQAIARYVSQVACAEGSAAKALVGIHFW